MIRDEVRLGRKEACMAEPARQLLPLAALEDGQGWPAQGEWTYEDYLRLPDDGQRYEVIRGHLYVAASPNYDHQYTVIQLGAQLLGYVQANGLGIVLTAPFDVILPEGIAAPVEPDLLFIRKENQPRRGDANFKGAPDLVVEVLSPSNRHYDRKIKFAAYRDAGVQELWLADPLARSVVVYGWRDGAFVELERGGIKDEIGSTVLPGFRLGVAGLFP
jgi:Uma2 family endonuclease